MKWVVLYIYNKRKALGMGCQGLMRLCCRVTIVLICKAKQKCINLHLFVFIIQVILSTASNLITHSIKDGVAVIKFDTPDSKVCVFLVNYLVNNTVIITTYFNPDYFSCFMWIL